VTGMTFPKRLSNQSRNSEISGSIEITNSCAAIQLIRRAFSG